MVHNCKRVIELAGYSLAGFAVIYLTFSIILCFNTETAGHAFGMLSEKNRMVPAFADLRAITALAGCKADLNLVIEGLSAGCDPYGRTGGLGYPPLIYQLARTIGVTGSWTGPTAAACGITLMVIVLADCQRTSCSTSQQAMIAGALLLSFPAQLAMERMNVDMIILIGLRIVAWMRDSNQDRGRLTWIKPGTAAVLVAVLGGSKIYPSIGVLAWFAFESKLQNKIGKEDCLIAAGAIAGMALSAPWILSGDTYAIPPISLTSHGLVAGRNGEPMAALWTLISIGSMVAGYWGFARESQREHENAAKQDPDETNSIKNCAGDIDTWTSLSFLSWVTSYCLTTSFDYRLIFLFPLLTKLPAKATKTARRNAKPSVAIIGCAIAAAYLYLPFIYMWIEESQMSSLTSGGWQESIALIAARYGTGALSRLLDLTGLPYLAGICACYVKRGKQDDKMSKSTLQ